MADDGVDIHVEGLWVSYRRVHRRETALRGVDLRAAPGRVTGLIGRNGAGKTTLLRTLLGFQAPDRGHCTLGGSPCGEYRERQGIGYVPEAVAFPLGWTVADVLARGADLSVAPADRRDAVTAAVERGRFDRETLSKAAMRCSKGTRQRLMLAYALIGEPQLVLLDEPFSGLDPPSRIAIRDEVESIAKRGATVLLASHDLGDVARVADTVFVLSHGRTPAGPIRRAGPGFVAELESIFQEDGA